MSTLFSYTQTKHLTQETLTESEIVYPSDWQTVVSVHAELVDAGLEEGGFGQRHFGHVQNVESLLPLLALKLRTEIQQ